MSDMQLRYVLGSARYANAENLTGNLKLNLPVNWRVIPEADVVELVSLAQRYDRERQASSIHRIYGRLGFITTNELLDYNPTTLTLIAPLTNVHNYNLQLVYPSSHISDLSLSDFSSSVFPLTCAYYDNITDCGNHKIYHGLPFYGSSNILYNGRNATVIHTYNHKYGNNIQPDDYVYIIPGKGGTLNPFYGIVKVHNVTLDDGTPNVLILDKDIVGNYGGSYKRIANPSANDIQFVNTIDCELYITSTTNNELFVCTIEQHNVIVGDYIDLRQSGTTFNQYNGIHKVIRIITGRIFVCDVPSHLLWPINPMSPLNLVPSVSNIVPTHYTYKYRVLDGDPSEYYIRKFKVLVAGDNTSMITGMDYCIQQLYLSNTIWKSVVPSPFLSCGTEKQSGSDDDCITSFVFNQDVDISKIVDNWGRPITELYLGLIRRKNPAEFNNLTTNFQGALMYSGITVFYNALNLPTYNNPTVKAPLDYFAIAQYNEAGLNIGDEYYGDLCEFNVGTLEETRLDPLQFRIGKIVNGSHVEGYVYEPFQKIQLKYLALDIEEVANTESVYPSYAIPYHTTYRWRPPNPYGWKEVVATGVRSVDDPFVNGAHYSFVDTTFYLRRQNKTPEIKIAIYDASC